MNKRVGYLASGPRVSTRPDAEATGARARLVGVINGFESLGWEVKTFIVGDRVPSKWVTKGSARAFSGGFLRTLAADLVRLYLSAVNGRRAWQEMGGQIDWLFEHFATLQSPGWVFKRHGVPWILHTDGLLFYEAKVERQALVLSGLARWIELRAYQECDVLVCVSETLKEIIVQESGISPEKVVLVQNGVDAELFNPQSYQAKRVFDNFTIGFVGNLYAWAGLELLVSVVPELLAQGMDLSIVIVGDGAEREKLQAQTEQLGVGANVAFVGRVPWPEVPQYLAGFDVAYSGQVELQLGKMYHSPLKLYEYMAMAKPVIASAFDDAQRLIQDGKTGFLFTPGDATDLKQAISRAYQSQSVLPSMGDKAREHVVAEHSWTARISSLITEVERILGKSEMG